MSTADTTITPEPVQPEKARKAAKAEKPTKRRPNYALIVVAFIVVGAIGNGILLTVIQGQHRTAETISYLALAPDSSSSEAAKKAVEQAAIAVSESTFQRAAESDAAAKEVAENLKTSATPGELTGRMKLVTDGTTPVLTIRTEGATFEGAAAEANAWTSIVVSQIPDTLGEGYTLVTLRSAAPGPESPLTILSLLPGAIIGLAIGIAVTVLIGKRRRTKTA